MFYLLRVFLRILITFFRPVFWDLICDKFAILKNKKLSKILETEKFLKVTKLSMAEVILVACILILKTHDWYESYETPFLFRVNMLKLFCSLRFGLKTTFYGTSKFVLTLYFCEPLFIIVQENRSMQNIMQ